MLRGKLKRRAKKQGEGLTYTVWEGGSSYRLFDHETDPNVNAISPANMSA